MQFRGYTALKNMTRAQLIHHLDEVGEAGNGSGGVDFVLKELARRDQAEAFDKLRQATEQLREVTAGLVEISRSSLETSKRLQEAAASTARNTETTAKLVQQNVEASGRIHDKTEHVAELVAQNAQATVELLKVSADAMALARNNTAEAARLENRMWLLNLAVGGLALLQVIGAGVQCVLAYIALP